MTLIRTWLDFALQQMAGESYIHRFLSGELGLNAVLKMGSNNLPGDQSNVDVLSGKTRMTTLQAQAFESRYQIVDHHVNDASGFSATLLLDTQIQQYTLSMRSTEYAADSNGGDRSRDIFGADTEIKSSGFALAQLVSMKRYFEALQQGKTSNGTIDPVLAGFFANTQNTINVTGYSLSGHLATVFTELYAERVAQTYTFNAAGRGDFRNVSFSTEAQEADRIRAMVADLDARLSVTDPLGALFASGAGLNIYEDERYLVARDAVQALYPTRGTQEIALSLPGVLGGISREDGAFAKITQLFGHAETGQDVEIVANSGIHARTTQILIEGQPLIEDINIQDPLESQYGNSHSITLIVDSLALQELFQTVDPTLTQAHMEGIFRAVSDAKAVVIGQAHVAEGDTLELALDALRKVFVGPQAAPTDFNDNAGGFGDLGLRNQFYTNLQTVRAALNGQTYQIASFAEKSSREIYAAARSADATGLAYRYALKELNPFAVRGVDYGVLHNQGPADSRSLDLYDAQTGLGTWTFNALSDRAELLAEKLKFALADGTPSGVSRTLYEDKTTNFNNGRNATATEVVIFGGTDNDPLDGRSGNDHLYGGAGGDVLNGFAGQDYLEGGIDNDELHGGSDNDILLGQQGNDKLYGEADNDRLNGGLGNDKLDGGLGVDTYFYRTGQGQDRIVDADKIGTIVFDNQTLVGGIRRQGMASDTWISPDGVFTYVKSGTDLVINGTLTIENFDFQNGALGVKLADAGNLVDNAGPVINYNNGQATVRYDGDSTDNTPLFTAAANHEAYGYGGNDILDLEASSTAFNHQIFGGDGHDELHGGQGHDRIYGEAGRDLIFGVEGDDVLDGGGDVDLIKGGIGQDILYGGAGNDFLDGGSGEDVLFGGTDNDVLSGESIQLGATTSGDDYLDGETGDDWVLGLRGDDVLYGGDGADFLYGDQAPAVTPNVELAYPGIVTTLPSQSFSSIAGGADYLDGGIGADYLQGDAGDDMLFGGEDNDELVGDDLQVGVIEEGDDWIEGGGGNDTLIGGGGEDALYGGDGEDVLVGDYANNAVLGFDDTLDGGAGNDELQGGGGADLLLGGTENDRLFGEAGDDVLVGGQGADQLWGGEGHDDLAGGAGDDLLFGEDGDDFLDGEADDDELRGGIGNDDLVGGSGVDRLFGEAGDDALFGDEGNDQLIGGSGNDVLDGGTGSDAYVFNLGDGQDVLSDIDVLGETNTLIFGSGIALSGLTLDQDAEQQTLTIQIGSGGDSVRIVNVDPNRLQYGIQTLAFADGTQVALADLLPLPGGVVVGNEAGNTIRTGATDDRIDAGGGDDVVSAGDGNDTVFGGDGNDQIEGGTGNDRLFGGAGDDVIAGQGGADVIDAGTGNDRFIGSPGSYTYVFGAGSGQDVIDGSAGGSYAVMMSAGVDPTDVTVGRTGLSLTLVLPGGADTLQLTSFYANPSYQIQFADGTVWNASTLHTLAGNRRVGTEGDDFVQGFRGFTDELVGLGGNDVYIVNDATDSVVEQSGGGQDLVVSAVDFLLADTLEDLSLADPFARYDLLGQLIQVDPAARFATGNALGNELRGNSFNNVVIGGDGDDTLDGGRLVFGNQISTSDDDTLIGGSGSDTYIYDAFYGGVDTIIDQSLPGESNSVVFHNLTGFGSDSFAGFHLELDGTTLVLQMDVEASSIVENTRELRLPDFDPNDAYGPHAVDLFDFGDSGTLTHQQLIDRGIDIHGTSHSETVQGTNAPNRFHGSGGNDTLIGNARNDVYVFDRGDGADTIIDTATSDAMNEIRFGQGITLGDLEPVSGTTALTITVGDNGDAVTLSNFDPTGHNGSSVIGTLAFSDGFHMGLDEWLNLPGGTEGSDMFVGTAAADRYAARGGDDTVLGGEGSDLLLGGTGKDVLAGEAGDDRLLGGVGNDQLDGGSGKDQLEGGVGNDTLTGGAGNDILDGGIGADIYLVNAGDGQDVIRDTVNDGDDNRLLFGPGITPSDLMFAVDYGGSYGVFVDAVGANVVVNRIYVQGFDQYVDLPNGHDAPPALRTVSFADGLTIDLFAYYAAGQVQADEYLAAGTDDAVLIGGAGNDTLQGGNGHNSLIGGAGNDTIYAGAGDDLILAGAGDDVVAGEAGIDRIYGGAGLDYLYGGDGSDVINGDEGNDVLVGESDDDTLIGGAGNDVLNGGSGNDHLVGGDGEDTVYAGTDNDLIEAGDGNDVVAGEDGTDTIYGGAGVDYLYGGSGEDRLFGGDGDDTLVGEDGRDVLDGGTGNDVLQGGAGADQLNGGDGDDTLYIDAADTIVIGGNGYDVVVVTGIEGVTLDAASSAVELIAGSSGDDLFTAIGGVPPVTFYGGEGADELAGGTAGDVLVGEGGDDVLSGGAGNDVLNGGVGDDTLTGGSGDDAFYAGAGNDLISGGDGTDSVSGDEGSDVIAGGADGDYLYGGTGDDVLNGEAGNDVLVGEADNDTLVGGAGNDRLAGGAGNDVYHFGAGDGSDVIAEYDETSGNQDELLFDAGMAPLDLVLSQQANDLRIAIHGTEEQILLENWFLGEAYQVESFETGTGETLLNTQVDQLIQAMAGFSQQSGLTWDQAIDQRPQDVQTVLAASWQ